MQYECLDTADITPTEAAVVASVTVRDVNRVIDERILPDELYVVAKTAPVVFSLTAVS